MESATVTLGHAHAEHEHHGPPEANQSSRIDKQILGILLFIVSEVMLFGAFFAVLLLPPRRRRPAELAAATPTSCRSPSPGSTPRSWSLPSFTIHYALESIRRGNQTGLKLGLVLTWMLGATFLFIQINEYVHIGFSARDLAFGSIFYSLTGLHGAHVFVGLLLLSFATIRAFRGHFGPKAKDHLGVEVPGHLLALRRRDVDHCLRDRVHPLGRPLQTGASRRSSVARIGSRTKVRSPHLAPCVPRPAWFSGPVSR